MLNDLPLKDLISLLMWHASRGVTFPTDVNHGPLSEDCRTVLSTPVHLRPVRGLRPLLAPALRSGTHLLTPKPAAGPAEPEHYGDVIASLARDQAFIASQPHEKVESLSDVVQHVGKTVMDSKAAAFTTLATVYVDTKPDGSASAHTRCDAQGKLIYTGADISIAGPEPVSRCGGWLDGQQPVIEAVMPGPDRGPELSTLELGPRGYALRPCYAEISDKSKATEQKLIAEQLTKQRKRSGQSQG